MQPIHWQTAALAVLVFAGWQAESQAGVQIYSLGSPITGQPAQLLPPGAVAPSQVGQPIQRHSGPRPPAALRSAEAAQLDSADPVSALLATGASLNLGLGFDAIDEATSGAGHPPPDPNVAISSVIDTSTGAQYFVETVNRGLQAFDQNGMAVTGYTQFSSFFGSSGLLFDPRLVFDPYAKRFFAIALESDYTAHRGYIHVAVSATADPRGAWSVFRTDVPFSPTVYYPDYPSLGFDRQAIYVGVNLFRGSTDVPPGALLYRSIGKASMLSATPQITTMVDVVQTTILPQYHWSMRAAQTLDLPIGAPAMGLFIGTFRDNSSQTTLFPKLHMVKVRKPLDATQLSFTEFDAAVPGYREPFVDAPQWISCAAAADTIDVSSGQLQNAVWRQDDLYAAHTVHRQAGTTQLNAARWYQIRTGPPDAPVAWSQLVQTGEIHGSSSDTTQHTYLPTVGVDAQRSLVVAYAQSSPAEPVSFWITARAACAAEGQMQYQVLVASANHCYKEAVLGTPPYRWGDYWAVAIDPASPTLLWAVGEYVKSDDRYGTWIQAVDIIPECPICACGR
ncbi:MAG TPA: hypothetical protein VEW48_07310 [Thermoanaerobaculia bacterium]|nr:hypothetical protein [Thermoanaerobaculia bacterium]